MSGYDVEALLEETSKQNDNPAKQNDEGKDDRATDRDENDRGRDGRMRSATNSPGRDFRPRNRRRGSNGPMRRSRSRDNWRGNGRGRNSGDYYRGGGNGGGGRDRSRSRSPRAPFRGRDNNRGRDRRDRDDRRGRQEHRDENEPSAEERDKRTVFVQQLANRLRTRDLKEFFEQIGPVHSSEIVKDRVSGRSKGVGYVEFQQEESVAKALSLTGRQLAGIPVIVQLTEAEKNRQARANKDTSGANTSVPFHRLYVGNVHFNVNEQDLEAVFGPFGELEFVQLTKDETGRSRGYGFVQFRNANEAREALEKLNGFDLAGRPIRVGLGNDKFSPESTANLLEKFPNREQQEKHVNSQPSFSGYGGRGGGRDRDRDRDEDSKGHGASALDDSELGGVSFNKLSRTELMKKLARTGDEDQKETLKPKTEVKALPVAVNTASRCVVLHNMFDPAEEAENEDWVNELEDDVRQEAQNKYGNVVHIAVDPNSKGDIYLKFDKVQGGENAIQGLNGRFFGGRMISAAPVVDAVYSSLFARTRAF